MGFFGRLFSTGKRDRVRNRPFLTPEEVGAFLVDQSFGRTGFESAAEIAEIAVQLLPADRHLQARQEAFGLLAWLATRSLHDCKDQGFRDEASVHYWHYLAQWAGKEHPVGPSLLPWLLQRVEYFDSAADSDLCKRTHLGYALARSYLTLVAADGQSPATDPVSFMALVSHITGLWVGLRHALSSPLLDRD